MRSVMKPLRYRLHELLVTEESALLVNIHEFYEEDLT